MLADTFSHTAGTGPVPSWIDPPEPVGWPFLRRTGPLRRSVLADGREPSRPPDRSLANWVRLEGHGSARAFAIWF